MCGFFMLLYANDYSKLGRNPSKASPSDMILSLRIYLPLPVPPPNIIIIYPFKRRCSLRAYRTKGASFVQIQRYNYTQKEVK